MEIASISAALTSIKTATEIVKLIKDSDVSLERAETKYKLADLTSALADAKLEVTEIQQLLTDKDVEIRSLQQKLALRTQLIFEQPYYWLVTEHGKEGPFCQRCFDADYKQIWLQGNGSGFWRCTVCEQTYTDKDYKDPGPPTMFAVARGNDRLRGF